MAEPRETAKQRVSVVPISVFKLGIVCFCCRKNKNLTKTNEPAVGDVYTNTVGGTCRHTR